MAESWRPWQPGDDPLEQRYMTPEQRADVVARVLIADAAHRSAIVAAAHRWGATKAKLTAGQIIEVLQERGRGRSLKDLAEQFGCSQATISRTLSRWGRRWGR